MSACSKRSAVGFDDGVIEAFDVRMGGDDEVTEIDLR
jgi:hypothetical protein